MIIGIFSSCSTEKNTPATRTFHNVTSKYNIFFNGNESFKRGVKNMEESHQDDFTRILPVFMYGDENTAGAIAGDMERAIQKATKVITLHSITVKPEFKDGPQTEKQKELYARNEYNKFVPGNYLLMGKAYLFRHDYYLALETFKFIMTEYSYDEIVYETQIWIARTYNELKQYDQAEDVLEVLTGTQEFPEKLKPDLYITLADLYMKMEQYERAIDPMTRALELAKKKENRIRWTFILAQLHQEAGDPQLASKYYRDVIKMNPDYEMSFNARINRASVFMAGSDNAKEIREELEKMLKDDKNYEFRDQIYYALGNVSRNDGDEEGALGYYRLSSASSIANPQQKTTSCLTIADIYYARKDYEQADMYYDSAMVSLNSDYPDYEKIVAKTASLGKLVENLQVVQLEDSLQMLAGLSESERVVIIDSIIARIEREEQRAREMERQAMQDQQFNRMALNESKRTGFSNSAEPGGKWYFYNQAAKGFGQPEFKMKWGNRKLEDNWRRSNKTTMTITSAEEEGEVADSTGAVEDATKILSRKSREYYLKDIPLNDSMMELSDDRIIEGLHNAGNIYRNELKDYREAEKTYKELINRYPGNQYTLSTYYSLYSMYNELNDASSAEIYKASIVREYPESQPAQLLTNPNYISELQQKLNAVNVFYRQTYDMFYSGSYDRVIENADTAIRRWPDDPARPKFEFLKVLAIGKSRDMLVFAQALDTLSKTTSDPEIAQRSKDILAYIMDSDREVKVEAQKIEAEVIYRMDSTGTFTYGMFVPDRVDINQLKFEFINMNLDNYPNRTFDVLHEDLSEDKYILIVRRFADMEQAWSYYDRVMQTQAVFDVLGDMEFQPFIISGGNELILLDDRIPNKYWLFFQKYYSRNERDKDTLDG